MVEYKLFNLDYAFAVRWRFNFLIFKTPWVTCLSFNEYSLSEVKRKSRDN